MSVKAIFVREDLLGFPVIECTSTTRPAKLRTGWLISETDTGVVRVNQSGYDAPVWSDPINAAAVTAHEGRRGITKLSVAPDVAGEPVALGANDPFLDEAAAHLAAQGNVHGTTAEQVGAEPAGTAEALASAIEGWQNAHVEADNPHGTHDADLLDPLAADPTSTNAVRNKRLSNADLKVLVDHRNAIGNPHMARPEDVGAVPNLRQVIAGAGLDGGGTLGAGHVTLSKEPITPALPEGPIPNPIITLNEFGDVIAAERGDPAGVGPASSTQPGSLLVQTAPEGGGYPTALTTDDDLSLLGVVPAERKILTDAKGPLRITPDGQTLGAGDVTVSVKTGGITENFLGAGAVGVEKVKTDRTLLIMVDNQAARLALGALRRGQLVYQHDTGAIYKSRSNSGTDAASATWVDIATNAAAANETTPGVAEIATRAETGTGTDDARIVTPLKLAQKLTPEAWIVPTLANGWVNYGTPYDTAGYRKDPLGRVHLKGLVKNGTAQTTIFTLPVGYRPAADKLFLVQTGAGASARLEVNSNGTVVAAANTVSGNLSLEGVSFHVS